VVDGGRGVGNDHRVDNTNKYYNFHSNLSYAIEICLVNTINNFSHCKMELALVN
jgi:hypothetical protein